MTTRGRSTNGDDVEEKKKNGKNTKIHDSHCLVEHQNQLKHLENVGQTDLAWYSIARWRIR